MIIEGEPYIGYVPTVAQAVEVLGDRWQAGLKAANFRYGLLTRLNKDKGAVIEQLEAENTALRGRLHTSEQRIIDLQRLIAEREIAAAGVEGRGTAV